MARIFVYDGREIDDPNPEMSVEEVREYLSHFYPELNNATTNDRSKDGDQIYEFRRRVGVKGTLTPGTIMDILASTPELQLDIITMAQDATGPDGAIDYHAMGQDQLRLERAQDQLDAHVRAVRDSFRSLLQTSGVNQ